MSQESTELSAKQRRGAILVAEDELTNEQIAGECGIAPRTLDRWKRDPEFTTAVRDHVTRLGQELSRYAIARKDKRMAALNDRWERAHNVILARANDPDLQDVPEGTTGLVVKKPTMVTVYETAGDDDGDLESLTLQKAVQLHYEYAVDTGLMAEMRQMEKQAAMEAGQWSEKHEHSGEILIRRYIGVDLSAV